MNIPNVETVCSTTFGSCNRPVLLCYGAQFSPSGGPVDGGTLVTIRGRYFGSDAGIFSAKLASVECSVELRNDSL